jgi:hypothetical protein
MQLTVSEQRSIERGEVVRLVPAELSVECVVTRGDLYDQMQSERPGAPARAAFSAAPASRSSAPARPVASRFQPASRRWNLVGMAIGTGLGVLPAICPAPVGPEMTWVIIGTVFGFFAPFAIFVHGHFVKINQKVFWTVCQIGAEIGIVIGLILAFSGGALPKEALTITGTGGFFAGFAVSEMYLRRVDAKRREDAEARTGIDGV